MLDRVIRHVLLSNNFLSALLLVTIDGRDLGKFPDYRAGSAISVLVNRNGQLITIEAMYNRNGLLLGGQQAVIAEGAEISEIYLFGRDTR